MSEGIYIHALVSRVDFFFGRVSSRVCQLEVYDDAQVYPEYIIIYRREFD